MFNKTALYKKNRLLNNSAQKFRKTLIIKRNIMNLKKGFAKSNKNNEYSQENISNFNIKTASNSKIATESSLLPAKTESEYKIRKNFLLSTEKNEKSKQKYDKIYNLTNKDFYKIKTNLNLKNEYIQCKPNNIKYIDEFRNIRKKDKKIDNMAKKLILKLNEDEYYNKEKAFKLYYGNNITLKNGFFNGENLVINNDNNTTTENEKIQSLSVNNQYSKKNKLDFKYEQNLTQPNTNNTLKNIKKNLLYKNLPSNLPLYLRDKANIQGTEILSPFCKEARDEFLFNKIFNQGGRKIPKRFELINNKLNIFYAENEIQYDEKLKKFNNKMKLKGKKIIHEVGPTKDQIKLNKIKSTLDFIKKIFDYSYPNMVLSKVRKSSHEKHNSKENNIPPYKKAELLQKQRNDYLGKYLQLSLDIQKNN